MALEELKAEIEHEAKIESSRIEKDSESEAQRIISEARKRAEGIMKASEESSAAKAEQRRLDYLSSLDEEMSAIISEAMTEAVDASMEAFLPLVREKLEAAEQEIIKSALERFGRVVPLKQAVATVDKRNDSLVKGVGSIEHSDVNGILLSSKDGSITADATIESLLASNSDAARRALYRGMVG